jgi:hypothetical protein
MEEISTFLDMLSACREKMKSSTNLQGIMKSLMEFSNRFENRNNNSNKDNIQSKAAKTNKRFKEKNMADITMNTVNNTSKEIQENSTGLMEDNHILTDMSYMIDKDNLETKMYWNNMSGFSDSEEDDEEKYKGEWKTVTKKNKKKGTEYEQETNKVNETQVLVTTYAKKNDIQHNWQEMDNIGNQYKSTNKSGETNETLSNIEKYWHNRKIVKSSNSKEIMKTILALDEKKKTLSLESKHKSQIREKQGEVKERTKELNKLVTLCATSKQMEYRTKINEKNGTQEMIIANDNNSKVDTNEKLIDIYNHPVTEIKMKQNENKGDTSDSKQSSEKKYEEDTNVIIIRNNSTATKEKKKISWNTTQNTDGTYNSTYKETKSRDKHFNNINKDVDVNLISPRNQQHEQNISNTTETNFMKISNSTSQKKKNENTSRVNTSSSEKYNLKHKNGNQKEVDNTLYQDKLNQAYIEKQKENEKIATEDKLNYAQITDEGIIITSWSIIATSEKRNGNIEVRAVIQNILDTLTDETNDIFLIEKISENKPNEFLNGTKKVPLTENELKKFIDDPRIKKNNKLTFRIRLGSTTDIRDLMDLKTIKNSLFNNRINMKISYLTTNRPVFAGFYDEPNPEQKKIFYLEERIRKNLNDNELEFQVMITQIFCAGKGNVSTVYMILTNKEQVEQLRNNLSIPVNNTHTFYQWDHYEDLSILQKMHLIRKQQYNNNKYRSQIINGFKNDIQICSDEDEWDENIEGKVRETNTEIWIDDSEMEISRIEKINNNEWDDDSELDRFKPAITDSKDIERFLKSTYKLNDGRCIIQGVIGPTNGRIQVWYLNHQKNQTESLLEVLVSELARNMDASTIQKTFEDPTEIDKNTKDTIPWKPTKLIRETPEDYTDEPKQGSQKKRNNNIIYYVKNDAPIDPNEETRTIQLAEQTIEDKMQHIENKNSSGSRGRYEDNVQSRIKIDHNVTKNEIEEYCKQLIQTSTKDLKKQIEKNSIEIAKVQNDSKKSIINLESTMLKLQKENNKRNNQQQTENKSTMENILQNQEIMLKHLIGTNSHTKQSEKSETSTYEPYINRDECKWDDYQNTQSQNNNKPDRTATSYGNKYSCDENKPSAAGKQ